MQVRDYDGTGGGLPILHPIRERVVRMLLAGSVPREFKEYSKLLRRIGWDHRGPQLSSKSIERTPMSCGITTTFASTLAGQVNPRRGSFLLRFAEYGDQTWGRLHLRRVFSPPT